MAELNEIYAHNPDCPVRQIGEGLVIMAPQGETTHSLEEIGAFIWNQIDGVRSLEDILAAITAEYAVDRDTATEDLLPFVQEMANAELLILK